MTDAVALANALSDDCKLANVAAMAALCMVEVGRDCHGGAQSTSDTHSDDSCTVYATPDHSGFC